MVRYLLNHRIAVIMAFLALAILGCVTYSTLPVSLLPDIDIPHITVQIVKDNTSARELENTVVAPLRRQLLQVNGLGTIKSETRDGSALIALTMDYGVDTDLAFIDVNEKIDGAMNMLPKDINRPKAVKASATDIPVVYLQMTSVSDNDETFTEMSGIARDIVCRRLEQLPEIAMVDITGIPEHMIKITPDRKKMSEAGVSVNDMEAALIANNVEPGSMTVRDGYYEYNIHVTNLLRSINDIKDIRLHNGNRIMRLGDFADVNLVSRTPSGYSLHNGKRAVTLAIIKHNEESMDALKDALRSTITYFADRYPDIEFTETRSQTELLDFTISNLEQNLILGLILVFIVCALFMNGIRSSFIIGLSIITSIIITFLLFYLFHVSINIISMSGLILAVGMMIDNSVIVTENITQYRHRGNGLIESCVSGTNEMITPMLSSSLTTIAVFLPLIFMSGIAGAIFSDQAFSITAGLTASYIVGITLLPILYYIFARKHIDSVQKDKKDSEATYLTIYDAVMDFCFRHKCILIIATLAMIPLCAIMFMTVRQERMPFIDTNETLARIEWNENINLDENLRRSSLLADSTAIIHSAYIGPQDYLLSTDIDLSSSEAELYFKTKRPDDIGGLQKRIKQRITSHYPQAKVDFSKPENIFEKIFADNEANIEVRLHSSATESSTTVNELMALQNKLSEATAADISPIPVSDQIDIMVDREKLALYHVDYNDILRELRMAFKGNTISTLRSFDKYTPIEITDNPRILNDILNEAMIRSGSDGTEIPLRTLITTGHSHGIKTITAGESGEYIPIDLNIIGNEQETMQTVRAIVQEDGKYDVDFAGSFFNNMKMMKELIIILLVSIMLMYFILCAQFESFTQPLIVLLEIPVDIVFALIALTIFGQTLNLMSAIGIIVTCGIVVNDSILKLDAINDLRKNGMPLLEAIHTAGRRRLRPIIMTSLTTVFAMVPVLFTSDMGSELQRPLAIAMIGSMIVGTIVSIFVIPLFYWLIYRKNET